MTKETLVALSQLVGRPLRTAPNFLQHLQVLVYILHYLEKWVLIDSGNLGRSAEEDEGAAPHLLLPQPSRPLP